MATFLELVQDASNELSIDELSQVFGSSDENAKILISLGNREAKQFSEMASNKGGWQDLHKEHSFQTVAITTTGDTTAGSKVISNIPDTSAITADIFMVSGDGLPYQAKVVSVDNSMQVTLDRPSSATGTGTTLVFGQFAYPMPSDFSYFINRTFWDGAYQWELLGPILAAEKQVLRYGVSPTGPRRRFYIKNNNICIDPMPAVSGQTIAFDYYSSNWGLDQNGDDIGRWQSDNDTYKLDDDCFVLGLKWRFLRAKGMDYAQEYEEYIESCQKVMSRDGGSRVLPLNARVSNSRLINNDNVPDTGYGQ